MIQHVLICGLGSIGRRHLRHLRALGVSRIDAYRSGLAALPDADQPAPDAVYTSLAAALLQRPQAVVVANPSALHVETTLAALRADCHVLVEKPLSHSDAGLDELTALAQQRQRVVAVACNLRFHPFLERMHQWVHSQQPFGPALCARAVFEAYLPNWHPWEDYRASYAARRDLGGGAALTHIHEIDYALWLFGLPQRVAALAATAAPLGTEVDETCAIVIEHQSGVLSTLALSLGARPPSRTLDVAFRDGRARVDLLAGSWESIAADGQAQREGLPAGFSLDDTYRAQAQHFLAAAAAHTAPKVSLSEGIAALHVALTVVPRSP